LQVRNTQKKYARKNIREDQNQESSNGLRVYPSFIWASWCSDPICSSAMLDATVDHVSIAVRDMRTAIPFYSETLGASFLFAGERHDQGFRWGQFRFPGGGKVELVTPAGSGGFVARFLERRGEGVHHVTLKVPDIRRALTHLGDRGVPLFNVSIDRPEWKEAFIHPRDANGTLIQLAQAQMSDEEVARHHLKPHDPGSHRHLTLRDLLVKPPDKAAETAIS